MILKNKTQKKPKTKVCKHYYIKKQAMQALGGLLINIADNKVVRTVVCHVFIVIMMS